MSLSPGDKLGPYEILSAISAGGMGEVYKARDTRLDRTVAIKVLPDHIAQREDLRDRFHREALAVAARNHPNICTHHDVGLHITRWQLCRKQINKATIDNQKLNTFDPDGTVDNQTYGTAMRLGFRIVTDHATHGNADLCTPSLPRNCKSGQS